MRQSRGGVGVIVIIIVINAQLIFVEHNLVLKYFTKAHIKRYFKLNPSKIVSKLF